MSRPTPQQLHRFLVSLDQIAPVRGAGVGFVGDGVCQVLRPSHHSTGLKTFVILQEDDLGGTQTPAIANIQPPDIGVELVGLGLNCAGAALSWGALLAEGAAVPLTGGASSTLMLVTWGAAIATGIQCGTSILRSVDVGVNKGEWTRWLDSQDFYLWSSEALDGLSLLGAVAAGALTVRAVLAIRKASGRTFVEIVKGMSRAERKRLTQELIRIQRPGISNTTLKTLVRAGTFPSRFASSDISEALFRQLRDAISATLAFTSSAASGDVKLLYVHVFQE
ncbi:MAG: hypothetical protein ABJA82_10675 [Myxococcales bacterium]